MTATFPGVIAFAFMVSLILAGVAIRARFKWIQSALIPASLIAGLLGFTLINVDLSFGFVNSDFTAFAFHFFTLSFMSLVLVGKERTNSSNSIAAGGTWLSVIWVMSLVLQGLVGLGVIALYNKVTGNELSHFLGMIATHGFTQGPGQALAMGTIWSDSFGISHAADFGLIYASAGFVVAFVVGVPAARYAISKGMHHNKTARIDDEFLKGILAPGSRQSAGVQVTHAANVDSLTFHLAVLALGYVLTDQYLKFVEPLASEVNLSGVNLGILFSHNLFFIHGLIVCVILRALIDRVGWGHLIDNETQKRITGTSVDLMVVATIMSIQFSLLSAYLLPITLTCIAISLVTALLCYAYGRSLKSFSVERAVTVFGCCTGSTGSGLLLLRILDPNLSTPIAKELAFFNIAIIVLSFHILAFMAPVLPNFELATIGMVYSATFLAGAAVLAVLNRRRET
ncbi:MAG: sodium/glutamate symporter [bacterium]